MSRVFITAAITAALACGLSACGSVDLSSVKVPSFDTRNFSLGNTSVYRSAGSTRPVGPEDLVDSEGHCAGAAPAQVDASLEPALAQQPAVPRGVALQMTECEVTRALGQAQRVEVTPGAGERSVLMTYTVGERAGIYSFRAGRLVAIERGAEQPPPPAEKKPAKKKPARKPPNA